MRTIIGGVIAVLVVGLVYFHTPDGGPIAIDPAGGQVIIRPSPPGYICCTLIQTGTGMPIVVKESFCVVAHALDRKCKKDVLK
jgi:hypothetical protein